MRTVPWIKILAVCQEYTRVETAAEKSPGVQMALGQPGPNPAVLGTSLLL